MVRHTCLFVASRGENCSFLPWEGAAGTGPTPQKGGKWHARPARPDLFEGLASSKVREAIDGPTGRASGGASRGVQGVCGPGPESKRAAGPLVESLSLHPRPVGREHRTPQGLDEPGQFELQSLFLGRARCQVPHNCGFESEFRMD